MIEAGAPSTGRFVTVNCKVCTPHRRYSWSHHRSLNAFDVDWNPIRKHKEAGAPVPWWWELRLYERSRCAEHGGSYPKCFRIGCARPTGDGHDRTTDAPAQRFNGVNLRATLEVG